MNILITICARGGSKGIPGKNIKQLSGKPLIAYSIEHAKQFSKYYPCDISLSTDDKTIMRVAGEYGLTTDYIRPAELASDNAGKVPAIAHLRSYEQQKLNKEYDYVLDLDVSAPMRTAKDLINGFQLLIERPDAYNLFSVSPPSKNPYFNMVEEKSNGFFALCKQLPEKVESRQQAPKVYEMNASFYFYAKSFFDDGLNGAITSRSLVYEIPHLSFDLDHPIDFDFLSFLIEKGHISL